MRCGISTGISRSFVPGCGREKLYEELLIDAESEPTRHPLIFRARERAVPLRSCGLRLMCWRRRSLGKTRRQRWERWRLSAGWRRPEACGCFRELEFTGEFVISVIYGLVLGDWVHGLDGLFLARFSLGLLPFGSA